MSRARPAPDFAALCFHGLAHLSVRGPSSLRDRRYLRWAEAHLPREAIAPLSEDAPLIAARYDAAPDRLSLQLVPLLHTSIDGFLATARQDFGALDPSSVDDPAVLRALLSIDRPLVELFRGALLLAAPAFRDAFVELGDALIEACDAVSRFVAEAATVDPTLGDVELAHALGTHGRSLAGRIFAGVPSALALPPATPAVLALHEAAVVRAAAKVDDPSERFIRSEWAALVDVASSIGAAGPELRNAHRCWIESLDLDALCGDAARLGLVEPRTAEILVAEPARRTDLLAAL